ncbi:uncharacterized protein AC631_02445 [Debaryomyces fabryi]|uniref:CCZ1/INTU/HSP4 first Longin domain-containing protein n=1 Tax=Debaryomyces fabryi TaxID=58627 RepID=A0A0V1PZR9_9ASCO|nr:uncharacterized protein AC631_02445 [Debaryomyces fabryi]KSA01764.1 hypothetical protein AC631_02445 [Debaryomyces fabryi]CUM46302.1 unnamed protein product [Debaryomyces fabryi]
MNNYFTQFIPQLGRQDSTDTHNSTHRECLYPKVKYICVFNPSHISDKCESNNELIKQILCFVSENMDCDPENRDVSFEENDKLKIIGLVRGINSFMQGFAKDVQSDSNIIKTDTSLLIVKQVEASYYIICCVSISAISQNNSKIVSHQMSKLIDQAYNHFVVLNGSFERVLEEYNLEILKNSLDDFWREFIGSYNSEYLKFPSKLLWANCMNYRGFLGLLGTNRLNVYKKSSIILNDSTNDQIDRILYNESQDERLKPKGLIISYFDQTEPKKYGMIYSNSSLAGETDKKLIQPQELINIYNWLEYYDFHHKLDGESLTSLDYEGFFSSSDTIREQLNSEQQVLISLASVNDSDTRSVMSTAASTFDMINPINLTNDYIILPFNSTMNNVMGFSGINGDVNHQAPNQDSSIGNWLSIPSYLKPFTQNNSHDANINASSEHTDECSSPNDETDDESDGYFIIGLSKDANSNNIITKRLVYLNSVVQKNDGELTINKREYLIIVYALNKIIFTLVYDSSLNELNQEAFYTNLSKVILYPLIEELNTVLMNGSIIGNSVGSLPRSLDSLRINNGKTYISPGLETDQNQNFYFIIYDNNEGWVKSSLPYLPLLSPSLNAMSENESQLNKSNIRYKSAIFHLHDQLSDIFIAQRNNDFFKGDNMNEFFHKFNSSRHFDWMFYYIKYNNRFIVIIKSRNRNHRITPKRNTTAISKKPNTHEPVSSIATNQQNRNMVLQQLTDYAHLGFLNNLGDDVKLWLESFGLDGEV